MQKKGMFRENRKMLQSEKLQHFLYQMSQKYYFLYSLTV